MTVTEKERRSYKALDLEVRKGTSDTSRVMAGHAAVFNKRSGNLGYFFEIMEPGCFEQSLTEPDLEVYSLFNHDESRVLGVTTNGSVRLKEDKIGLYQETDLLGDTTDSKDMISHLDTKRITKMSFAFTIAPDGQEWNEDKDGMIIRTITRVQRLYDVSPVTYPAYSDTEVGIRSISGLTSNEIMGLLVRAENHLSLSKTDLETLRDFSTRLLKVVSGVETEGEEIAPLGLSGADIKARFSKYR